jgi:hypothetical protein
MSFKKTFKVLQKAVPKAIPKAVPKSIQKTMKKGNFPRFFKMKLWKRATPKNRPKTPEMVKMRNSPVELSLQTIYSKSETMPVAKIHKSKSHTRKEYMKNQYKKSLKQLKNHPKKYLESVRLIV